MLDHTDDGNRLYRAFTRQHPRYLIIKQKTIGVAIIQLGDFKIPEAFTASVNGKIQRHIFLEKRLELDILLKPSIQMK